MPVTLSIKNVPDDIAARLKARAKRNHRSLQGELMDIMKDAAGDNHKLSLLEVLERVRAMGISTPSESADIIRRDRDSR